MKFKYYIRGIGVGIIFTTIILAVSFHLNDGSGTMSDAKVINRAKELGMEFVDTERDLGTEADLESEMSLETESYLETESSSETESDLEAETETEPKTAAETKGPLSLEVTSGMIWRDIANILYEEQIVEDADDFWNYVYLHAGRKPVYVGTFEIPRDASYDEIIEIITGR